MSRPRRHKSARIIGPCQYVYEKSVGPVGAMSYPDEVWGRCKPPGVQGWCLVGERGEVPRISEDLAFCTTENGQKQQDFR